MSKLEKWGLATTILSLFIRQLTIFPEETIAIVFQVTMFLIGWYLFLFSGRKL